MQLHLVHLAKAIYLIFLCVLFRYKPCGVQAYIYGVIVKLLL
jgi:hypothetical protein